MMIKTDMRFDQELIKTFIGKNFKQYKCDPFVYTNSVSQICGIYIDDEIYALKNIQQVVDYFGTQDDIAVFSLAKAEESEIKSCYENTEQIITPAKEAIESVTLINEHQTITKDGVQEYDVWLTRGIIIKTTSREYSFAKSTVPFSEEIEIFKGDDALSQYEDGSDFLEGWDEGIEPNVEQEVVVLQ